jgi:hypothetical protein
MRDLLVPRRNDRERFPPYLKAAGGAFHFLCIMYRFQVLCVWQRGYEFIIYPVSYNESLITGGTPNPQAGAGPVDG